MLQLPVNPVIVVECLKAHRKIVLVVIEMIMIRREVRIIVLQDFQQLAIIAIVFKIQAGIKHDLIIASQSHPENMREIHVPPVIRILEISEALHA
jgi:hypothetical protein